MDEHYYAAIMAGGGGTRLWPLSRRSRPKQSLALIGNRTLFQVAVDRVRPLIPVERIFVMTGVDQADMLKEQYPDIPEGNFLLEPEPRGTAAAIGLAAVHIENADTEGTMACLTADHFIKDEAAFRDTLLGALTGANGGGLFTLGIQPTAPDPSYGYIHKGEPAGEFAGHKAYSVLAFKEKPDVELAREYVQDGDYLWNSGMFFWRADAILKEIGQQLPDLHRGLKEIQAVLDTTKATEVVSREWNRFENITIDYGVMEAAHDVYVLPASDLGWVDVGDWGRLFDILADDDEDVLAPDTDLVLDSTSSMIVKGGGADDKLVAVLGVKNLIVIETDDVLLVCNRQNAEKVKRIVEQLKKEGREQYL